MFEVSVEGLTSEEIRDGLAEAYAGANYGHLHFLEWVAEASETFVHRDDDCDDFGRWLAQRCRISVFKANRMINAGVSLRKLPLTALAFAAGEMSLDQLLEFTRYATPENEEKELRWAQRRTPSTIRKRADEATRVDREEREAAEVNRSFEWWELNEATMAFYGTLPMDQGLKLAQTIDRVAQQLKRADEDAALGGDENRHRDQLRADALSTIVSSHIARDGDVERATMVLYAHLDQLVSGDGTGVAAGGHVLDITAVQALLCDSRVQVVTQDADGRDLGVSSPQRFVPRWLRRALERRDHFTCTFPNCGVRAHLIAHHVDPWPKPTALSNLVLVCPAHHRLIHMMGWMVCLEEDGSIRWFRPDGSPYVPGMGPPLDHGEEEEEEEEWWCDDYDLRESPDVDDVVDDRDRCSDDPGVQPTLVGPRGP